MLKKSVNTTMFYNAKPTIFERAKLLRANMTEAELKLWSYLRNNKLGVRFKAQHPIDLFIADFYCHQVKLVVEVDGSIHNLQADYDEGRTEEIERFGIVVIRFANDEVIHHIDKVLISIQATIKSQKALIALNNVEP